MLKIIIVALLLTANIAVAQVTTCRPDGAGGFVCTERPKCLPGTVCS